MAESKKGHNPVNISHLNIDPNLYAQYQNPSSRGSLDIILTGFFYSYNGRVKKGALLSQYVTEFAQRFIRSSEYYS